MARLPVLIRRTKVFDLVVAGKSYDEIGTALRISEDTIARDMKAIAEQVRELVRERADEILAVALATYQAVVDHAWAEYRADLKREKEWYAGKLDYKHTDVSTKTLATEGAPAEGSAGGEGGEPEIMGESGAIEVQRRRRMVRPSYSPNRDRWLRIIVDATREITELCGIRQLKVEHTGAHGGPIERHQLTDAERANGITAILERARARGTGSPA